MMKPYTRPMKPAQNANAATKWMLRTRFISSAELVGSEPRITGGFVMRKPVMKRTTIEVAISQ